MTIKPGTAILQTEKGEIPLCGRVLSIILELLEMGEEINRINQGNAVVDWKEKDIKTSLTRFGERKRLVK